MELIEVQQIFLNYYERVDIYSLNKVSTGLINETFVVETNQGKYITSLHILIVFIVNLFI